MTQGSIFYLVGIHGSGKSRVCGYLAEAGASYAHVKTSECLLKFIQANGIPDYKHFNNLDTYDRDILVSDFHESLRAYKSMFEISFLDGHILFPDSQGGYLHAMPDANNGVANGLVYVHCLSGVVISNIGRDNDREARKRPDYTVDALQAWAENEFVSAESHAIKNNIDFGVIFNDGYSLASFGDIAWLNKYYISSSARLRTLYLEQFNSILKPSELRAMHYRLGLIMREGFEHKTGIDVSVCSGVIVPRSGRFLGYGFFSGTDEVLIEFGGGDYNECIGKTVVVIDSVVDAGSTASEVIKALLSAGVTNIHFVCAAINIKSLDVISSFPDTVSFHCIGFSNKEVRPVGQGDMGARLYGTAG